ncbi:MAG: hypothetical protein CM1200mP34_4070 [Verrucomicrobiales bacterium]|nr:MAG: hypothetical protein CM1200mP34_4070 [Verrucomicrobiales bacterium]
MVDAAEGTGTAETQQPPMGNPEDAEEAKPEPPPASPRQSCRCRRPHRHPRGKIKRRFFRSPKAPSRFELLDDNGRTINYLYHPTPGRSRLPTVPTATITFERLMGMLRIAGLSSPASRPSIRAGPRCRCSTCARSRPFPDAGG